jgi:hypothetical protein
VSDTIPLSELLFGADIYSGQGYPDVVQLEGEGHSFLISKATGEGSYINPYRAGNRAATRKTRMTWGDYDWVEPQSGMTGAAAAVDYWRVLNAPGPVLAGDLVMVDYETTEWYTGPLGRSIESFMRQYLFTLSDLAQQPIGIYTATYFLQETGAVNWGWLRDPRFFYWQAAPGKDAMMPDDSFWPATSPPFTRTVIQQHQWRARSTAVQMEFDRNRFWGTRAELLRYGKPGASVPAGGDTVREPSAGTVTWYVNDSGEPIFVWNMGGQTRRIRGVDIKDLGMTVESLTEPGMLVGRSIQGGVEQDFYTFPDPETQAHKNFLSAGAEKISLGSGGDTPRRLPPEEFVPDPRKLHKGLPLTEEEESTDE